MTAEPITRETIDEWKRLEEAATEGPWNVEDGTALVWGACLVTADGVVTNHGYPVAEGQRKRHWDKSGRPEMDEANAAFIAASREAVPALILEVERLTAALDSERSRKEGEWRDMASAPKDGTYILLGYFLEGGGGGEPSIAFWHSTRKLWCGAGGFLNAAGYFSPTHWMPLPLPPIQQGE